MNLISFFYVTSAVQDLDWTNQWLMMSVADYYGAATCLCAIAVASESWPLGFLWCIGFFTLGSPVCCLYCAQRYDLIYTNYTR